MNASLPGASAAASARNGTTAMSWNSTTLKASRPCVRLSSARSVSCCTMSTVELMATTPPITMLCAQSMPNRCAMSATTAAVPNTCSAPEAEHLAAQRHHARPREFQAQREQQEDDAELRQQVRGVGFGEQRRWRAAPAPGRR